MLCCHGLHTILFRKLLHLPLAGAAPARAQKIPFFQTRRAMEPQDQERVENSATVRSMLASPEYQPGIPASLARLYRRPASRIALHVSVSDESYVHGLSKLLKATPMIKDLRINFGHFYEETDTAPLLYSAEAVRQVRTLRLEDFTTFGVRGLCDLLAVALRNNKDCVRYIQVSWHSSSQPPTSPQITILRDALQGCIRLDRIRLRGSCGTCCMLGALYYCPKALAGLREICLGQICNKEDWLKAGRIIALSKSLQRLGVGAADTSSHAHTIGSSVPFWDAVRQHRSLQTLSCSLPLSDDAQACTALERALAEQRSITEVYLLIIDNVKANQALKSLAEGILRNPRCPVQDIRIEGLRAEPEVSTHVGRLAVASSLRTLNISMQSDYELDKAGYRSLGDALARTTSLKELQLRVSVPSGETLDDFSRGLRANPSLDKLYIRSSSMGKVSIHDPSCVLQALEVNDTVRELELYLPRYEDCEHRARATANMLRKNKSIEDFRTPLVLSGYTQQQRRMAEALQSGSRQGLRCLELKMPRPQTDWVMLLDVIKRCPCLETLKLNITENVTASHVAMLRETIRNHTPALARVLGLDEDGNKLKFGGIEISRTSERNEVPHRWLDLPHTAGRACCMLRLLRSGSSYFGSVKSLDTTQVCRYAACALRQALEVSRPGDCITIAHGVLDCLQQRSEWSFLPPLPLGATAASGLFQAVEDVARGRTELKRDMPGGEWFGAAVRCTQVLQLEGSRRRGRLALWRRGMEANRDAGMVFQAASEGRPLELGKRLRLGKLAGGLDSKGVVTVDGHEREVSALESARLGGHGQCVIALEEAMG